MGKGSSILFNRIFIHNTGGSFVQKQTNGTDVSIDANFNRVDIPFMFGFKLVDFSDCRQDLLPLF